MEGLTISVTTYILTIIFSVAIAALIKLVVILLEKFSKPVVETTGGEIESNNDSDATAIAVAIAVAKSKENK